MAVCVNRRTFRGMNGDDLGAKSGVQLSKASKAEAEWKWRKENNILNSVLGAAAGSECRSCSCSSSSHRRKKGMKIGWKTSTELLQVE